MVNSSFLPVEVHVRIHPRSLPHSSDPGAPFRTGLTGKVRLHAVAAAAVLALTFAHPGEAFALALGPVQVKSALGEPIRAEIDIPEITPQEASSLQVRLASADALRAAGIEASSALAGVEITLQRRSNGRPFLRISGNRPVNEPFVDLVLEANWATGRLVRDYTLLFDPPNLRAATPAPAPLPPVAAAPAPRARPAAPVATPAAPAPVAAAPAPARAPAPAAAPAAGGGGQVTVRTGDTAGKIAAANKPSNVSLEQMLVAMLQSNPQAFIDGNVNRIKAGSVLDMPTADAAQGVDAAQARQTITAQSRDFNEFRRRLAGAAPTAAVAAAGQQASGKVQAEVKDAQPSAAPADKLTLSKPGAAGGAAAGEDKIAQARQTQDTQQRTAELNRNIEDLAKLAAAPASAVQAGAAPAAPAVPSTPAASGVAVPAPDGVPATPVVSAAAEPAAAPQPPAAAAAPAAAPAPAPADMGAGGLVDQLRDNPLVLPGAAALLALLAGFGLYRFRQRKARSQVDSSFLESRLQPDSFFGSSGGQRIDTAEAAASGSSMVYSPSQLDAAGDVDPVAEADVYLAYGRDLQAEEILKEALRTSPSRVAIHSKLSEIYAKRRDARAFEVVAAEAFGLTQGRGDEWDEICQRGRDLDPSNPLYQPGGVGTPAGRSAGQDPVNTMPFGASSLTAATGAGTLSAMGNLDVDLDLSLDDDPPAPAMSARMEPDDMTSLDDALSDMADLSGTESLTAVEVAKAPAPMAPAPVAAAPMAAPSGDIEPLNMEFDIDFTAAAPAPAAAAPATPEVDKGLDLPGFELDLPPVSEPVAAAPAAPTAAAPLSFDLAGVSLDLDTPASVAEETTSAGELTEENPLETKLSLAEEFRAIGDIEGARSLAEEVMNESSGTLQSKARTFLADLA